MNNRELHHYLYKRRAAIERNHGTDEFCSACYQANPIGLEESYCCGAIPLDRVEALIAIDHSIQEVVHEIKRENESSRVRNDIRDCTTHHNHLRFRNDSTSGVVNVYIDDVLSLSNSDPKRARKWLRSRGLSITNGEKRGNDWYL